MSLYKRFPLYGAIHPGKGAVIALGIDELILSHVYLWEKYVHLYKASSTEDRVCL